MKKCKFNRGDIMRRAHEIARLQSRADAQKAHDRDVSRLGYRIVHNREFSAHLAETRADIAAAMKQAWAEAKDRPSQGRSTREQDQRPAHATRRADDYPRRRAGFASSPAHRPGVADGGARAPGRARRPALSERSLHT